MAKTIQHFDQNQTEPPFPSRFFLLAPRRLQGVIMPTAPSRHRPRFLWSPPLPQPFRVNCIKMQFKKNGGEKWTSGFLVPNVCICVGSGLNPVRGADKEACVIPISGLTACVARSAPFPSNRSSSHRHALHGSAVYL